MYPYQRTPMGNPYISLMSYNPQESLENTTNAMGTLLGVHPSCLLNQQYFLNKSPGQRSSGAVQGLKPQSLMWTKGKDVSPTTGCPVGSGWINGDRINGLFHLLISGIYRGYDPFTNHSF